jgi:hypothetical protein
MRTSLPIASIGGELAGLPPTPSGDQEVANTQGPTGALRGLEYVAQRNAFVVPNEDKLERSRFMEKNERLVSREVEKVNRNRVPTSRTDPIRGGEYSDTSST